MTSVMDILVPDGVTDAAVIEIMLEAGAVVETDESLLAIETDKATAEVPAPAAGKLIEISVQTGDSVSSGSVIGKLQVGDDVAEPEDGANAKIEDEANIPANIIDIVVPNGVADAAVIEIMREAGAEVETDESLLAIETDKATAEVPAPAAGKLLEISVQTGDSVSSGSVIGRLQVGGNAESSRGRNKNSENAPNERSSQRSGGCRGHRHYTSRNYKRSSRPRRTTYSACKPAKPRCSVPRFAFCAPVCA